MTAHGDAVQKLWSLSNVLRDDGMVYHQYMTELTYLLFLKIAQETGAERSLPAGYRWKDLVQHDEPTMLGFYRKMLTHLGEDAPSPEVRQIFAFPTTVFKHSANLRIVIERIDALGWYSDRRDDFGDVYEGLLEKNAIEAKSGAGQYFTPRALVDSIVSLTKPKKGEVVQDPAAGTGGFIISADRYVRSHANASAVYEGVEIVKDTHRLCLMNLFVHSIDGRIVHGDALSEDYKLLRPADLILTNPPFGARGAGGAPRRVDLPHATANKQLLFLQHIYRALRPGGRGAVVVPDNVLFEGNVAQRIRSDLLHECELHTILRLPRGIFYSAGVNTNVLFFSRKAARKAFDGHLWVYDARTNVPPFGKRTPLTREFFADFERCFGSDPNGSDRRTDEAERNDRWRRFSPDEINKRSGNLDISWLREDASVAYSVEEGAEITAALVFNLNSAARKAASLADLLSSAVDEK
jgi:type I restriction enzyme M protein